MMNAIVLSDQDLEKLADKVAGKIADKIATKISIEKMNINEAADYLKMSASSVRRLITNGEIKPYRVGGIAEKGGNLRFTRKSLDAWVDKQEALDDK